MSFPPDDSSKDSSSSDIYSSAPSVELPECGVRAVRLSQRDSGAPYAFVLPAGPVASALASAPAHGSSDRVVLDPLIGLLLQSPDASSHKGRVVPGSAADI